MTVPISRELFLLNTHKPILGEAFDNAFTGFVKGAERLLSLESEKWSNSKTNQAVNSAFWDYFNSTWNRFDPHLTESPYPTERRGIASLRSRSNKAPDGETRVSLLLKGMISSSVAFEEKASLRAESRNDGDSSSRYLVSPLYFLRQFLTAPDYPASEGYAHAIIRAEIFKCALLFDNAEAADEQESGQNHFLRIRDIISFSHVTDALQTLSRHRLKRDSIGASNASEFLVFSLLASKGILMLRFANERDSDARSRQADKERSTLADFFKANSIWWPGCNYEFRVSERVEALPSAAELMNELDGMPLPLPGADTVFSRGLRFTRDEGLVGRVSGHAGSGKTSFALGLAAALSPLGTKTLYVSAEERPEDLDDRLTTLIHPFIRRTESFDANFENWFESRFLGAEYRGSPTKLITQIKNWIEQLGGKAATDQDCPPGLMPLMVVLDGVHEFYRGADVNSQSVGDIAELVDICRQFGALVVILSASQTTQKFAGIDYLVDFVISLDHRNIVSNAETPSRLLTLHKTRRQTSRPGTHIFHLSQAKGFRISPHIEAELDSRRAWSWLEPKIGSSLNVLQRGAGNYHLGTIRRAPLVRLYERSQILITGEGSAGKSAMALKIIAAPLTRFNSERNAAGASLQHDLKFEETNDEAQDELDGHSQVETAEPTDIWDSRHANNTRRALVISFLYQDIFYRRAWKRVRPNRNSDLIDAKNSKIPKFDFDVLKMRPGHLGPEDFLKIVTRKLDEAELSGFPYFGVVVDGLHNVYLQFPELEKSEMIWPLLFELFRLKDLTVVTTHTSFKVGDSATQTSIDVDASRRRIGPLLHALVQGADFTLQVKPPAPQTFKKGGGGLGLKLELSETLCSTALDPKETRETSYFWDRNDCVFIELPISKPS